MALTRANATTAISGTIPASSVADATVANISALPASIPTGALILLSTQTASASASIEFTSGIDSTYSSYIFKFIDIHPSFNGANFQFQSDTGTNTNYNQTITSTYVVSYHNESDTDTALEYNVTHDQAQGTSFQTLCNQVGADNDQQLSGTLQIFNPSSSVFVKHFIADIQNAYSTDYSFRHLVAGYFNLTTPLTRFQFKMHSGNIDDGIIKMYGVS